MERTLLKRPRLESNREPIMPRQRFHSIGWGSEKNGEVVSSTSDMPYASVRLRRCGSTDELTGFITHKVDFAMLWAAFNEKVEVRETRFEIHSSRKRSA